MNLNKSRSLIREKLKDKIRQRMLTDDSDASDEAKRKGLEHKGWGRYGPPGTKDITHKSEDGKLVPVSSAGANTTPTGDTPPASDHDVDFDPTNPDDTERERKRSIDKEKVRNALVKKAKETAKQHAQAKAAGNEEMADDLKNAFERLKKVMSKLQSGEIPNKPTPYQKVPASKVKPSGYSNAPHHKQPGPSDFSDPADMIKQTGLPMGTHTVNVVKYDELMILRKQVQQAIRIAQQTKGDATRRHTYKKAVALAKKLYPIYKKQLDMYYGN